MSWCRAKIIMIILLRLIFKSKASVGIYFSCETVTGLTSQLHSMLSNHIHSYSTGSHGSTEKTTTAPEEGKPRVTALPHTHIKHYSVIKFSRIPQSAAQKDSLLWAVQGCQDHHNDSKLLSPLFRNPRPHKMFLSLSSFQVWRAESLIEMPVRHCVNVGGLPFHLQIHNHRT